MDYLSTLQTSRVNSKASFPLVASPVTCDCHFVFGFLFWYERVFKGLCSLHTKHLTTRSIPQYWKNNRTMEQGSYNSSASNSAPGTPTAHSSEILSNLQRSMFEEHASSSSGPNPLLARLNQNRNELAELEAVSHQLGPDGTMPPAVIGDYVGPLPHRNHNNINNNTFNSGFDEYGEEEVNELDEAEDFEGDDDDVTLNFNQTIGQADDLSGMTLAKRAEAKEAASAVDPQSLIDAGGVGG